MPGEWFAVRRSGLGWTPVSPAGWAVTVCSIALVLVAAAVFLFLLRNHANPAMAAAFLIVSAAIISLGAMLIALRTSRR